MAKNKKHRFKNSKATIAVFWVCLVLILLPFLILGYILLSSSHELTGEMPKTEDHITITGSVWKVRETATDGEISVGVEADLKTGKIPLMVRITRKACPEAYDDLISDSRHKRLSVDGAIRCDAYTNGQVAVNVMKINATKAYALNPNKTKNEIRNKRKNI